MRQVYLDYSATTPVKKEVLQEKIREIMANIKTNTAPRKEQTTAINKLQAAFFEGF